jgi:hypothetical protein
MERDTVDGKSLTTEKKPFARLNLRKTEQRR